MISRLTIYKEKYFCLFLYITMLSPIHSNISQNNAKMLEKQWQEIQQRYEKEQWLLIQLEEVAKSCRTKCVAQKARKKAKAKAREEAEKRRIMKEKKKKKKLEYLQQLQNEILAEDAALLKGTEKFQIIGSKYKKVILEDDRNCQSFKKTKGKQPTRYYGNIGVKIGGVNSCKKYVCARQDYLM